jgi:putative membrane protein
MMWGANEGMGWWMLFGGVFWILFLGTLVYAFVALFDRDGRGSRDRGEDPLDVAKRRLAAGEITMEEFERIKQAIR